MMRIIECEQGSPEWFRARMGMPTASEFKTIIGVRKDAREKATRTTYLHKLAGEILTGEPTENYSNEYMERGKIMEDEARNAYAFQFNADPQRVGFIADDMRAGCSPDALLGGDGVLEIKTKAPHLLIPLLRTGEFPAEHKAQCQGALLITGRKWVDLVVYWPKLPLYRVRALRDDGYIANIAGAVREFNAELDKVVAFVRGYQPRPPTPMSLMEALQTAAAMA